VYLNSVGINPNTRASWIGEWYPKGPILIKKFGMVIKVANVGSGCTVSLKKGATGSTIATINCSTTIAAGLASKAASSANSQSTVGAGSYIYVEADGTGDSGSMVCFIDYVRAYSGKHAI